MQAAEPSHKLLLHLTEAGEEVVRVVVAAARDGLVLAVPTGVVSAHFVYRFFIII